MNSKQYAYVTFAWNTKTDLKMMSVQIEEGKNGAKYRLYEDKMSTLRACKRGFEAKNQA